MKAKEKLKDLVEEARYIVKEENWDKRNSYDDFIFIKSIAEIDLRRAN